MAKKGKKGKKENDSKAKPKNESNQLEKLAKQNVYSYYTNEEIAEIKSVLKIKDLTNIPIIIGSIIVNKFELLKTLIKQGHSPNEIGPNNHTALVWAAKYKYLDMIEFLLSNGSDPTIKTENGENVLITALEHKLWDEQTFINLWDLVKNMNKIEVNVTSKNGHNMLHIAVRRDWGSFIHKLIAEKVDIDAQNINGVTSLMMACFRNNLNIVNLLINAGANVLKEDHHGRLALCYAISAGLKTVNSPYSVADRVIVELKKRSSFKQYLKRKLEMIFSEKCELSLQNFETLTSIIQYTTQFVDGGVKILLDLKTVEQIHKGLRKALNNDETTKLYLTVVIEMLFYNEQSHHFKLDHQINLIEKIVNSGLPVLCLELLDCKKDHSCISKAFYLLLLLSTSNEVGKKWLQENYETFQSSYRKLPNDSLNNFHQDFLDEKRLKLMKKKMKKFKRQVRQDEITVNYSQTTRKDETQAVENTKKKRRTKSLKTRMARLKTQELSERLLHLTEKKSSELIKLDRTSNSNKTNPQTPTSEHSTDQKISFAEDTLLLDEERNPMTGSLLQFLERTRAAATQKTERITNPLFPEWKLKIINLPFDDGVNSSRSLESGRDKLKEASLCLKQLANGKTTSPRNVSCMVDIIIDYLSELLQFIICKYQKYWEDDRNCGYWTHWDPSAETSASAFSTQETTEKLITDDLRKNFAQLVATIRDLTNRNITECYKNLCQLESLLLNFQIRGKSVLSEVAAVETIKIKHLTLPCDENDTFLLNYIEGVLNDHLEPLEGIKINVCEENYEELSTECPSQLYYNEMSLLTHKAPIDRRKEADVKKKTMDNAYHLYNSMASICDSDEELVDQHKSDNSEMVLKHLTKHVDSKTSDEEKVPSRWADRIQMLQMSGESQKILDGDIRICKRLDKRLDYIISQGGNFNPVILGLKNNNQPLAVKRIPKDHSVCEVMKALILPLLLLRHPHLLHYHSCDYEDKELILATPLCEFNIGQYVLLMKEAVNNNYFNLTPMEIVRQFLTGLMFLHERSEPIVHGNLKPSNIFIDLNGVVRVAEFGIHKALFKLVEAPKSSLIWFSQETYQTYKQSSVMECSIASDIQVAGMLVYFILSGGIHPYGSNVIVILKNLEKAILSIPRTGDLIFMDLVTWMMMYDPNERPNINQVLAHVLFWSTTRRWHFVLNCAGINHNGAPLSIDIHQLHATIDKMSVQEKIKGNWVGVVRSKFPNLIFFGEDSVTGLLKFIRDYYEQQTHVEIREAELCNCILNNFPAFPLSLYRILEASNWLEHPLFLPYLEIELQTP